MSRRPFADPQNTPCEWVQSRLFECFDNALNAKERASIEQHLSGCQPCANAWASVRTAERALLDAPNGLPTPGDLRTDFYSRLQHQNSRANTRPKFSLRPAPITLWSLVGTALTSLVILVATQSTHSGRVDENGTKTASVATANPSRIGASPTENAERMSLQMEQDELLTVAHGNLETLLMGDSPERVSLKAAKTAGTRSRDSQTKLVPISESSLAHPPSRVQLNRQKPTSLSAVASNAVSPRFDGENAVEALRKRGNVAAFKPPIAPENSVKKTANGESEEANLYITDTERHFEAVAHVATSLVGDKEKNEGTLLTIEAGE